MTERPTNTIPDKHHAAPSTHAVQSHAPVHTKEDMKKEEQKKDAIKTEKKETPKIVKKEEAVALARSVPVSLKQGMHIGRFIKHKSIDQVLNELDEVIALRRAVPFSGEIPHRKGKGMMSGRYPVDACKVFKVLVKNLRGNCVANGLDMDKVRIYFCSINWAARPMRRGGRKGKRSNITLKAKEVTNKHG